MTFNPEIHHRHSIRLPHYDYSQSGYYFVTLCARDRECLFGDIENNCIVLNSIGMLVKKKWHDLPGHFPRIELDNMVIMPNHLHGIIIITDRRGGVFPPIDVFLPKKGAMTAPLRIDPDQDATTEGAQTNQVHQDRRMICAAALRGIPLHRGAMTAPLRNGKTLGQMIAWFKYESTKEINLNVSGNPNVKLWQRNYFERIVRNDEELNRIRNYIATNPETWEDDENYI